MEKEKIILNGKELTLEEFTEEKNRLLESTNIKLVEVAVNTYVTRLLD